MNIIGTQVKHKSFGIGRIKKLNDNQIIVAFGSKDKKFLFPDAFSSFLTTDNDDVSTYVNNLLEEKVKERQLEKQQKVEAKKRQMAKEIIKKKMKSYKRVNVAFKCNYCDGGSSEKQVGFNGVCSDKIIYNNIKVEKRTWCNVDDCPCLQYLNNDITRKELDEQCQYGDFVCYESQMLRDWTAFAGYHHNGKY